MAYMYASVCATLTGSAPAADSSWQWAGSGLGHKSAVYVTGKRRPSTSWAGTSQKWSESSQNKVFQPCCEYLILCEINRVFFIAGTFPRYRNKCTGWSSLSTWIIWVVFSKDSTHVIVCVEASHLYWTRVASIPITGTWQLVAWKL